MFDFFMTGNTKRDQVRKIIGLHIIGISLFGGIVLKTLERYFMVNIQSFALAAARLTAIAISFTGGARLFLPVRSIRIYFTAAPTWVIMPSNMLRIPFAATFEVAEMVLMIFYLTALSSELFTALSASNLNILRLALSQPPFSVALSITKDIAAFLYLAFVSIYIFAALNAPCFNQLILVARCKQSSLSATPLCLTVSITKMKAMVYDLIVLSCNFTTAIRAFYLFDTGGVTFVRPLPRNAALKVTKVVFSPFGSGRSTHYGLSAMLALNSVLDSLWHRKTPYLGQLASLSKALPYAR